MTLEHVERERNYCSVARELKVPFAAVGANCSKLSRARESRLVRLSKECKHEQHGRRVYVLSGKSHATLPLRSKSAAAKPRRLLQGRRSQAAALIWQRPYWPPLSRGRLNHDLGCPLTETRSAAATPRPYP